MASSFAISTKFSFRTQNNTVVEASGDQKNGKNKGNNNANVSTKINKNQKINPVLLAKTDNYADDSALYQPRITRTNRYQYYAHLLNIKTTRKPDQIDADSWLAREIGILNSGSQFPALYIRAFRFLTSRYWDQLYFNFFLLWLVFLILVEDGWMAQFAPFVLAYNSNGLFVTAPPLLMLITQIFPLFGTVYFVHYCNDMVHHLASKDFQTWAFIACLLTQYIEYFHYGGQGRSEDAGNCQLGIVHKPSAWKLKVTAMIRSAFPHSAKIHTEMDGEGMQGFDELDLELGQQHDHDDNEEEEKQDDNESNNKKEDNDGDQIKEKKIVKSSKKIRFADEPEEGQDEEKQDSNLIVKDAPPPSSSSSKQQDSSSSRPSSANNTNNGSNSASSKEMTTTTTMTTSSRRRPSSADSNNTKPAEIIIEYEDWTCIVCHVENHEPKVNMNAGWSVAFLERGKFHKQTYALMTPETTKPLCKKCFTPSDYTPPKATAHLFPHTSNPYIAFQNYPPKTRVPHGLHSLDNRWLVAYHTIASFFFGVRDNVHSRSLLNDWQLRKYVQDIFPKIPRYKLKPGEFYKVGEIVESMQQKSEWYRARILAVRSNGTYDIRYDTGDELRFVEARCLRLGAQKGTFAYRIELGMIIIFVAFPFGLYLAASSGDFGLVFLGPLIVSVCLLTARVMQFIQYAINYHDAGVCVIAKTFLLFSLPLIFLLAASAVGISSASNSNSWAGIAALFILTKFAALPVLFMLRPTYMVIAMIVFLQTVVGMIMLSMFDDNPELFLNYRAIPLAPFITVTLMLKYMRREMHNIWDVCHVIRQAGPRYHENPILYKTILKAADDVFEKFNLWWEGA